MPLLGPPQLKEILQNDDPVLAAHRRYLDNQRQEALTYDNPTLESQPYLTDPQVKFQFDKSINEIMGHMKMAVNDINARADVANSYVYETVEKWPLLVAFYNSYVLPSIGQNPMFKREVFKALDQIAQAADILVRRLSGVEGQPISRNESAAFDGNKAMTTNFIEIFTKIRDDCLSRNLRYISPAQYQQFPSMQGVEEVAVEDQPGQTGFIRRFGELPALPFAGQVQAPPGLPPAPALPPAFGRPPPGQPPGYRRYPEPPPVDMGQYQQVDRGLPPYGDFGPGPRGAEESKGPEIMQEEKGQELSPEVEAIRQRMISQGLMPESLRKMEMASKEKTPKGRYMKRALERAKEAMPSSLDELEAEISRLDRPVLRYGDEHIEEIREAREREEIPQAYNYMALAKIKTDEARELRDRLLATVEYYRRQETKPELRSQWSEFERQKEYYLTQLRRMDDVVARGEAELEEARELEQRRKQFLKATREQRKAERAERKRLAVGRKEAVDQRFMEAYPAILERRKQRAQSYAQRQQQRERAQRADTVFADLATQQFEEVMRPMPPRSFWGPQGMPGQAAEAEAATWGTEGLRRGEGKAKSTKMSKLKKALKQIKRV